MNFRSGQGAEELTVYGWNTKVSAPLIMSRVCLVCSLSCLVFDCLGFVVSSVCTCRVCYSTIEKPLALPDQNLLCLRPTENQS